MRNQNSFAKYLAVAALLIPLSAFSITVELKELKDSRTTGEFFKGLDVELTLKGAELAKAKALRTQITSAKDSTGKNLIDPKNSNEDFSQIYNSFGDGTEQSVTIKLLNPERKAEALAELKGEVQLYVPDMDPNSTVTLKGFKANSGKQIENPALKAAGVDLAFYSNAQQEDLQKQEKEKRIAELKAQGIDQESINVAVSMMDAFSGGSDPNSITVKIADAKSKLVAIELQSATGEKLDSNGSMSSGETKVLYFSQPVPDDANIIIRLLTDKAVVKAPVQLAALNLP